MSNNVDTHRSPYAAFSGPNLGYVMEMYDLFKTSPESIDAELADMFSRFGAPILEEGKQAQAVGAVPPGNFGKVLSAYQLQTASNAHMDIWQQIFTR